MNLIEEENRGHTGGVADCSSIGEHVAHIFNTRCHSGEFDELSPGRSGNDAGDRGLTRTRRAPEKYGAGGSAM